MKPVSVAERFKNGNYKGADGFDVDPPPSYIDYGNNSQDKGGGGSEGGKGSGSKKWNFFSRSQSREQKEESEDFAEKKIEIKSVPFLHLVSVLLQLLVSIKVHQNIQLLRDN